jgi:hypothetical protein
VLRLFRWWDVKQVVEAACDELASDLRPLEMPEEGLHWARKHRALGRGAPVDHKSQLSVCRRQKLAQSLSGGHRARSRPDFSQQRRLGRLRYEHPAQHHSLPALVLATAWGGRVRVFAE